MSTKKAKPTTSSPGKATTNATTRANAKAGAKASEQSRRDRLAAQREAEQKRQKRVTLVGGIIAAVLALAVIAIVAVVVVQNQNSKREQAELEAASQISPPNGVDDAAVVANAASAGKATYTLNLYVDYQCGVCKQTEDLFGPVWKTLMDEGFVKMQVHPMTFMDDVLGNDSSTKVAIAATCADTTGKFWEYHNAAFVNQPEEGLPYPDDVITQTIPQQAGLTGADYDKWKSCYDSKGTAEFVRKTNENAARAGVTGTPTLYVNGNKNPQVEGDGRMTDWWRVLDTSPEAWKKAIADAAAS